MGNKMNTVEILEEGIRYWTMNKVGFSKEIIPALQSSITAIKERDHYKKSLQDIIKHQKMITKSSAPYSVVYNIAQKALESVQARRKLTHSYNVQEQIEITELEETINKQADQIKDHVIETKKLKTKMAISRVTKRMGEQKEKRHGK